MARDAKRLGGRPHDPSIDAQAVEAALRAARGTGLAARTSGRPTSGDMTLPSTGAGPSRIELIEEAVFPVSTR